VDRVPRHGQTGRRHYTSPDWALIATQRLAVFAGNDTSPYSVGIIHTHPPCPRDTHRVAYPETLLKLLIDFLPILLFFIVYKFAGIYWATAVAIGATAIQVAWLWARRRRVETMPLATIGLLVVFGGLTIALHDPIFVMWKPTLVNWLFAAVFIGSHWIGERTLIERLMSQAIELPKPVWTRLNALWSGFFVFLGLANLFVVYVGSGFHEAHQALLAATGESGVDLSACATLYSGSVLDLCNTAQARESTWVDFKLFGMMGLTIAFVIAQTLYLARHAKEDPEPRALEAD